MSRIKNRTAYMILPLVMNVSFALADSLATEPLLLSVDQMDQVTAGLAAVVTVNATGSSPVFTMTRTNASAFTAVSGNNSPVLGGYVEVAGGGAVAVAAGEGATTNTSVTPATSTAGMAGTYTNQAGGQFVGSLVNITANMVYTSGSLFVNPL